MIFKPPPPPPRITLSQIHICLTNPSTHKYELSYRFLGNEKGKTETFTDLSWGEVLEKLGHRCGFKGKVTF